MYLFAASNFIHTSSIVCPTCRLILEMYMLTNAGQDVIASGRGKKKGSAMTPEQQNAFDAVTSCLKVLTVNPLCSHRLVRSGCLPTLLSLTQGSNLLSRRSARTIIGACFHQQFSCYTIPCLTMTMCCLTILGCWPAHCPACGVCYMYVHWTPVPSGSASDGIMVLQATLPISQSTTN